MTPERSLSRLLTFVGALELLAVPTVFLPFAWMDYVHGYLGLGKLPDVPIVVYLTRSLSILYSFHGVVTLCLARDVVRYQSLIRVFASCAIGMGIGLLIVDLLAGLPLWWALSEGVFAVGFGSLACWLQAKMSTVGAEE